VQTVPASPPAHKTYPPVEAAGRLFCGTDRVHDLVHGHAVLTLTKGDVASLFWCRAVLDAGKIVALDLIGFGDGRTYRLVVEGDRLVCDCADSTYRGRTCKHASGLADALVSPQEHAA
jgi:hypothetical protein